MLARMMTNGTSSKGTALLLPRANAVRAMCGGRPSGEECQKRAKRYRGYRAGRTAFGILKPPAGHSAMTDPAYSPQPAEERDSVVAAYSDQFDFLCRLAAQRFRIPSPDDEGVVQEVFVTYLRQRGKVTDERRWLIAAVCNASRAYWRTVRKHEALHDVRGATPSHAEVVGSQLDARTVLRRLPQRCRELLRLKFYDGYTAADLAAHFETTTPYAKLMLHRCMTAARALLHAGER